MDNSCEMNRALPNNIMAMITLTDRYGQPCVNIAHREDDNDDTAVYSLIDYSILNGFAQSVKYVVF